ncbi:hypothetical protein D9C73_019138 [Collichthys lucidus]|uniref:Uncharacterized protein n=1 Tax=Collichthys lucidus TaxID=240159 RepID=A0A4U5VB86_COLLU|nr:hypothetical protein D9C73_019138 [Collichthys lucidus]
MSSEKNPEVVGCDASIMKNVWEIRERDYAQKLQAEEERIEKSALPSINQDWQNRLSAKLGTYKRVERKTKPAEDQKDNNNVWKSKRPQVPPTLPRGTGSGPLGRPGGQRGGFSTPAVPTYKDNKGQDKSSNRLQLLMFINQTQPSAIVWGKSWKYNKCLPSPEEGAAAASDWGRCWMFATQQPYSEPGKPWLNGPNMTDPHNLHLWKKPDYRMVESEELGISLPPEEWQMSWRKSNKYNKKGDGSSINGENNLKSEFFTWLVESQHRNESLYSEWTDSWKSTKPASQQDNFTVPNDSLMNESIGNKREKDTDMSPEWEESWRLVNHHGCNKYMSQVKHSHSPEWASSWRAAMVVSNNHRNSQEDHRNTCNDYSQQKDPHFHKDLLMSHEQKYRDMCMQLCTEFKATSEWSKSWQVTKNNTKPCEEIEKILKLSQSRMETAFEAQKMEKNTNWSYSTSEKTDPCYEQVIYHPKREFTRSNLLDQKHLKNVLSTSEWRDSWKALKHRMRMERRRMRPDPTRPFKSSDKEGDIKPSASEWKDSWKFACRPLCQEPEFWQQRWSTMSQVRVDRAMEQDHFAPVELPKNGPTGERSWVESWRFSRQQHRSDRQATAQTRQGRSNVAYNHPVDSSTNTSARHTSHARSDWQEAWMVSETQFHHDKPSLTQWREAWKWSTFNPDHWAEHVPQGHDMDVLMEIQPQRERISLQRAKAKMSRSFESQMFKERYPEKQWSTSWRTGKSTSSTAQQHHTTNNGDGTKWGMSFRLANPMPHMEQPWVESSPNPCYYTIMWTRGKYIQNNINTNFGSNPATIRLWGSSYRFLQGIGAQIKDITKFKEPVDPRVIITKKTQTKKHLYSNIEKEKQKDRKWPGCHLLGKTQPRPKKGTGSVKKIQMENENKDKFFEEWAESWRFLVRPGMMKKMPVKLLSGWDESWKFLIPLYQVLNGPKAK